MKLVGWWHASWQFPVVSLKIFPLDVFLKCSMCLIELICMLMSLVYMSFQCLTRDLISCSELSSQ